MIKERIIAVMAAVFGENAGTLGDDSSSDTVENWDSLRHMNLIVALEEEFGLTFDDHQIMEMLSFKKICDILGRCEDRSFTTNFESTS